ncbi:receptor-type tyrosine-protein phosphatase F-like [Halichondria panicea]|uniref:receptor-type tyrosine-protein phosphatase F-like n=1 Tax=Halichondria panicea TaxID=6063 RepID=UPI00312B7CA6
MGSTGYNCLLLLLALLSGTSAQIATRNCSLLREAPPSNAVFALGGGGCVNCTLGFRSARWGIELDGAFSAINAGQEPDECDCIISERRLCFQNVGADIVPNYRCQVQVDVGSDLVECGFQVQLASLPTIDSTLVKTTTVDLEASATLTLRLSEPGLPIPTISWLKDSNPITLDGRYSINSAGSLTIADVMAEDRGAYQVSISNIAGTVTENYMLFVNFAVLDLTYSELANGDGSVQCVGSGWPAPSPQDVSLTGSSTQVRTSPSMYEVSIVATETISNPAANCLPSYICTIAFGMLSLSQTLTPSCGTPPPPILILDGLTVDTITSSSAIVRWSYNGDASFTITVSGPPGYTFTLDNSMRSGTLTGLVPGTEYSIVVSVTGDPTTTTMPVMFTTISCPPSTVNSIVTVTASTVTQGNDRIIRLTWERSEEDNAAGYRLYVDPCGEDILCTPLVEERDTTSYNFPTNICDGRQYSFHVQSINECGGGGPNSSVVFRTCELMNRLVELEPQDTAVTIKWDYVSTPISMTVTAELVASPNPNQLRLLTYEMISNLVQESACIRGLETDTTYEVCLFPTFTNSTSSDEYCGYVTTTNSNDQSSSNNGCIGPSTSEPTSQVVVIENWQIAVIVVGGLAIVAMVFCLVGLCFACQSSKQKDDFGSNSSLNDPTYNSSSINGTVSMHKRSVSPPSRSCLSYHTKGHSTNWSDHVDTLRQMETDTGTHV